MIILHSHKRLPKFLQSPNALDNFNSDVPDFGICRY